MAPHAAQFHHVVHPREAPRVTQIDQTSKDHGAELTEPCSIEETICVSNFKLNHTTNNNNKKSAIIQAKPRDRESEYELLHRKQFLK